jgi:hypothetical protein
LNEIYNAAVAQVTALYLSITIVSGMVMFLLGMVSQRVIRLCIALIRVVALRIEGFLYRAFKRSSTP